MERLGTATVHNDGQLCSLLHRMCCQLEVVHTIPNAGVKTHQCHLLYPLGVKPYHRSGVLASFVHGFLFGGLFQSNHVL